MQMRMSRQYPCCSSRGIGRSWRGRGGGQCKKNIWLSQLTILPICLTSLCMQGASLCAQSSPKYFNLSQTLRFAEKLASGGVLCGLEAVSHPLQQKKADFETAPNDQCSSTKAVLGSYLLAAASEFARGFWGSVLAGCIRTGVQQMRPATT